MSFKEFTNKTRTFPEASKPFRSLHYASNKLYLYIMRIFSEVFLYGGLILTGGILGYAWRMAQTGGF